MTIDVLRGKWTPRRVLYLARAEEIDALCAVLNARNAGRAGDDPVRVLLDGLDVGTVAELKDLVDRARR